MVSFRHKLILLSCLGVFVPIAVVGFLAISNMGRIEQSRTKDISSLLIRNEHERLAQMARNQALLLDQVLSDNQDAVHSLSKQYELVAAAYPKSRPIYGFDYYPDKDRAGLPGYGYCHPQYGAFADWDLLSGGASPWIPKGVVEQARTDDVFKAEISDTLFKAASLRNSFITYQQTHTEFIDLVWIVAANRVAYTYPTDYVTKIAANPTMNDVDETQEPYVRDFTPQNNPERKPRWMPVYLDALQQRFMTSYVAPLYEGDVFAGTLGVDVLLPGLVKAISREKVGNKGYAFLLDEKGVPLAMPDQCVEDWIGNPEYQHALYQVMSSEPSDKWSDETARRAQTPLMNSCRKECQAILAEITAGTTGSADVFFGVEAKSLSYHLVPCVSWKVVYVRPMKEITAIASSAEDTIEREARTATLVFAFTLAFILLMSALVGVWASRQVTKPISEIVAAAEAITRDPGCAPEITVNTHDEFESLAGSLNTMMLAVRRSEAKYRDLVENANSIILRLDLEGRITFFNEYAARLFGYTENEIIGKNVVGTIVAFVDSAGHDLKSMISDLLRKPEKYSYNENENVRKNGETVWVSWSNRYVPDHDGGPGEVLCIGNDITERRRMEVRLLQAQRMEAVGQLAGGVAHDFNNLLQAITGYIEFATYNIQNEAACLADLQEAHIAAQRAATITRQLLAFSRRQVLQVKSVDMNEVVEDLVKMIRRLIGENIELTVKPGNPPITVLADRGQLEQVLMNLCVNARDAMPDGGRLVIETKFIVCNEADCEAHENLKPGRYVLLTVKDTGCGMDAPTMRQIFEPFFTTKGVGKGTGLGLATIYGIVQQHGGAITVASEPGKGTEFKIWWPFSEGGATTMEGVTPEKIHGGTETVLVAEDEEQVRILAKRILEKNGYRVLEASNGEEALRVFREHATEIGMLLLDVVMPAKGGRSVFEEIRNIKPEIKCLFASGYSETAVHTNFILKEGLHLLKKPYQGDDLLRAVRKVLEG